MHIAICHEALIPPTRYGGTERAIYWLAKALVLAGHKVTLLARAGSNVPGVDVIPLDHQNAASWESLVPASADIVHLFGTPATSPKRPFLVTIEGNGQPGEEFHPNTVFVSKKHAENHGSTHFVYNGIDPDDYPCDSKREDYLVFLAKASWSVKNLAGAIQIAQALDLPLKVMGSRNWPLGLHRLRPAFGGIHYLGMLADAEKREVLRKAKALLFPVLWHEPFGVAITEALASGCAVFGTPYGSLTEIVSSESGFLSNQVGAHVKALRSFNFSPEKCRARIYEGFTHHNMASRYLDYYRMVLEKGVLSEVRPRATAMQLPLAWNR